MNPPTLKPLSSRRPGFLPVLDRMVSGELAKTLLSVLAVLVTIIVSRKFLAILTKAIEGEVAADTLLNLLALKLVSATILLIPPSLFLALLMVFGRMYKDHEIAILASSGVGLDRLYRAIAWFVIPLFVLTGYLSLQVMPWSERTAQELIRQDKKTADLRGIKPGRFNEFSQGDVVLYAESLSEENQNLNRVFVQSRDGKSMGIVTAKTGYVEDNELGEHFVVLKNGQRYQGVPGQSDFVLSDFETYAVKIDEAENDGAGAKREATPTEVLWNSKKPRERAELQRRFAIPASVLILSLLAIPLSRVAPRGGVYGNVFIAFLIFICYENLQRISQGLLINGKIPAWLSYSAAYLVMLAVVIFLLLRAYGARWLWQAMRTGVQP